jgi:hypothetical protein
MKNRHNLEILSQARNKDPRHVDGTGGYFLEKITRWFGFHRHQKIIIICGDKNIARFLVVPDLQK